MTVKPGRAIPLPKDAALVELRADALVFETRECLLPGVVVCFKLMMEGQPLPLRLAAETSQVVGKDRGGFLYRTHLSLRELPDPDRQLIALFILKGRGAPELEPMTPK